MDCVAVPLQLVEHLLLLRAADLVIRQSAALVSLAAFLDQLPPSPPPLFMQPPLFGRAVPFLFCPLPGESAFRRIVFQLFKALLRHLADPIRKRVRPFGLQFFLKPGTFALNLRGNLQQQFLLVIRGNLRRRLRPCRVCGLRRLAFPGLVRFRWHRCILR